MSRNERVWLFEPGRGAFLGSYVRFDEDEAVEVEEYSAGGHRVDPTHFWGGEGVPAGLLPYR